MIANAKAKYLRISPRKADLVARTVRGQSVQYALDMLAHMNKKAAGLFLKVIKSALANAENKGVDVMDTKNIVISRLVANPGPTLKRFRAASMGRSVRILKRTSHLEVELDLKTK
jgi:large subunit ribosomal protein L22